MADRGLTLGQAAFGLTNPEVKARAILLLESGVPYAEVAERFGIKVTDLQRWRKEMTKLDLADARSDHIQRVGYNLINKIFEASTAFVDKAKDPKFLDKHPESAIALQGAAIESLERLPAILSGRRQRRQEALESGD